MKNFNQWSKIEISARAFTMLASLARLSPRVGLPSPHRFGLVPATSRTLAALPARVRGLVSSSTPATSTVNAAVYPTVNAAGEAVYPPSYSRRARRERLHAALDVCRAGGEFVIPEALPQTMPGPCGAIMTVLRDVGPKTAKDLWKLVSERFPGVIPHKHHMKADILKKALKNKVRRICFAARQPLDRTDR